VLALQSFAGSRPARSWNRLSACAAAATRLAEGQAGESYGDYAVQQPLPSPYDALDGRVMLGAESFVIAAAATKGHCH
jgi:hypothetical protein